MHTHYKKNTSKKDIFSSLQLNLEAMNAESRRLEAHVHSMLNQTCPEKQISNDVLQIRWPIGVPSPSKPETRHDLESWTLLNETHQITAGGEENIIRLSRMDQEDINVSEHMHLTSS